MKPKRLLWHLIGLTLATLLLVGCNGSQAQPTDTSVAPATTPVSTPTTVDATSLPPTAAATAMPPTAAATLVSPTAMPTSVPPTPTTAGTKGQVDGVLEDQDTGTPIVGVKLLLGSADGELTFGGADQLWAESDETGAFSFKDVEPGQYGLLAFFTPSFPTMLKNEEGDAIVFEVAAGLTTDLGVIPAASQ